MAIPYHARALYFRQPPPTAQPAVHLARRRRKSLAPLAPARVRQEVLGRQPARPALPRPDGAGALLPRSGRVPLTLHGSDADHPRREARLELFQEVIVYGVSRRVAGDG